MHLEISQYKARIVQAVLLLVLGFFGFSVADLCSKILQEHYSTYQVLFISGGIGLIISTVWIITRYGFSAFVPSNWRLHVVRGIVTCGTAFCMVSALRTLPLADFYGIIFLSPFLLLIMSVMFLGEHVGWRRWMAVTIAFIGIIILAGPQFDHFGEGIVYAVCGALLSATTIILLRKIGHGNSLPVYSFYPSFFIVLFNGTMMLATDSFIPMRMEDAALFASHGPAAMAGVILSSIGYARSPEASIVAPFTYTQIIWGILFGWVFFHVVPVETTMIGLTLVIGAGCYSIWRDYRKAHDKHVILPDIT